MSYREFVAKYAKSNNKSSKQSKHNSPYLEPQVAIIHMLDGGTCVYGNNAEISFDGKSFSIPVMGFSNLKKKHTINRNLHENKPLAMAIGRWLVEEEYNCNIVIREGNSNIAQTTLFAVIGSQFMMHYKVNKVVDGNERAYDYQVNQHCTLPDNYKIPKQVMKWYKKYEEKETK